MTEYSLICNYKKCRIAISDYAWVTSCSHVFCDEHADQNSELGRKCPACETPLKSKYDIVRADLNPSEEFKSMILAGLRPELIMDIASRGIGFWCHQMFQEKLILIARAHQAETQLNQVESSYETLLVKMKNDRVVENKNFEALKKLSDDQTRRIQELESSLNKKNQQLRSLQMKLEMVKRENLSVSLSQGMSSPSCQGISDRRISPKYMDQQSMIHCPVSFSQQNSNNVISSNSLHHYHSHQMAQKCQNDKQPVQKGNIFNFKPNTLESKSTSQSCDRFNFGSTFTK